MTSLLVNRAAEFAASAHANQVDKAGKLYIEHVLRVSNQFTDDKLKIISLLHDVVEDTMYKLDFIEKEFGPEISVEV